MLLIDFDNTMMATEQYAVPSLIDRFNQLYGDQIATPLTLEIFKQHFHGQAREALCAHLSNHFKIKVDYPTLYADREWLMMRHLQAVDGGIPMAPGLVETLTNLRERHGLHAALVSNNPIQRALTAMRFASNGQGDQLACLLGTRLFEAGERQKPLPDVYQRAMVQLGITPDRAIAIEDSVTGTRAAVAAGLTTLGFTGFADDKATAESALRTAGCVAVFDTWGDLPALLPDSVKPL